MQICKTCGREYPLDEFNKPVGDPTSHNPHSQFTNCYYCRNKAYNIKVKAMHTAAMMKSRAKKLGLTQHATTADILAIFKSANGVCPYCHNYVGFEMLTIDHVVALYNGGNNLPENMIACCHSCNCKKSYKNKRKLNS